MGTAEGFSTPQSLELALVLEVGKAESHLPALPCVIRGREAFPIVDLTWEVLGCQDSCQCHHDYLTLAIGMPACLAFFWASSIMTMNWGMPSACA
jgi:hypothetical protein